MRLPNAAKAVLDIRKLESYCLNPGPPLGRHKARVFKVALGLTSADAQWLKDRILHLVQIAEAAPLESDDYGTRYAVDIRLTRQEREIMVRTAWIVSDPDEIPRFVTCWVL